MLCLVKMNFRGYYLIRLQVIFYIFILALPCAAQIIPFAFFKKSAPSCSGAEIDNYCWFVSASNQSCDEVCIANSYICNLGATRDHVGSGAPSGANCTSILNTMGYAGSATDYSGTLGFGCIYWNTTANYRETTPTTTCSAKAASYQRLCACLTYTIGKYLFSYLFFRFIKGQLTRNTRSYRF